MPARTPVSSDVLFQFFTFAVLLERQLGAAIRPLPQHGICAPFRRVSDPRPPRKGGIEAPLRERLDRSWFPSSQPIDGAPAALRYDVGQQAEEAGALDRLGEFALLLLGNGRDARGHDLAALGNVALQETDVLVVDPRSVCTREGAGLAARWTDGVPERKKLQPLSLSPKASC